MTEKDALIEELQADNARLQKELDEAKKDSERLDFLGTHKHFDCNQQEDGSYEVYAYKECIKFVGVTLREAIDNAMKGWE